MKLEFDTSNGLEVQAVKQLIDTLARGSYREAPREAAQPTPPADSLEQAATDFVEGVIETGALHSAEVEDDEQDAPDNGADVDSSGIKWIGSIHSSAKTKLSKTGRWKRIRGIDAALADRLEQEAIDALADEPATVTDEDFTPPPPPPPPPPPSDVSYTELVAKINAALAEKAITAVDISAACATVGLPAVVMASKNQDALNKINAVLFP